MSQFRFAQYYAQEDWPTLGQMALEGGYSSIDRMLDSAAADQGYNSLEQALVSGADLFGGDGEYTLDDLAEDNPAEVVRLAVDEGDKDAQRYVAANEAFFKPHLLEGQAQQQAEQWQAQAEAFTEEVHQQRATFERAHHPLTDEQAGSLAQRMWENPGWTIEQAWNQENPGAPLAQGRERAPDMKNRDDRIAVSAEVIQEEMEIEAEEAGDERELDRLQEQVRAQDEREAGHSTPYVPPEPPAEGSYYGPDNPDSDSIATARRGYPEP
jgi:hypothetical protein